MTVAADITALLRARNTLLWVTSPEELRVERAIIAAAAEAKMEVRFWDCATGLTDGAGGELASTVTDPLSALTCIRTQPMSAWRGRAVYVMRDLHKWLADPTVLRSLRTAQRELQGAVSRDQARAIVVLTPTSEIPPELLGQLTVLDFPRPDRAEVGAILDDTIASLPEERRESACANGARDAVIEAALGLTAEEIANAFARCLVTLRPPRIDPALVSGEKRRVIDRSKVLTWYDPDPRGLAAIGGLDALKSWLVQRASAFGPRARAFGLPSPNGILLVGVPGCGKSLTAKAVAAAWRMPLLRLDMGSLKSKWVGDSEANLRKALNVAETVSPCVLWLDEIEKALAGASGEGGDGGVSADALGTILSWMQERAGSVFVVATANDVRGLPPELLRKGRFDELWWVDLPTADERSAILTAALATAFQTATAGPPGVRADVDVSSIAAATDGFTGAELAALVPDAMFAAFADGERAVTTADLLAAAGTVVPLSRTAAEKIEALRTWATGRCRSATLPQGGASEVKSARTLDID